MARKLAVESTISRKNKKIKEANVEVNIFLDEDDNTIVEIEIDQAIEPYMRHRLSGIRLYDPLATYKNIFRKKVLEKLEELNVEIPVNEEMYVISDLCLTCEIPKSYSRKKKVLAYKNEYKNNKKPDVDNVAKTIYDSLEKIFFWNDAQIIEERFRKEYDVEEHTSISFALCKQPDTSGRLTNEELKYYKNNFESEGK